MKIQNKEIGIKIGNNEKKLSNLILNSYLDLFADSFLEFKNKDLPYCLINFSHYDNFLDENSTEMKYDTILEADFANNIEILTDNTIVNKYYYKNVLGGEKKFDEFLGKKIIDIGFANYDYTLQRYVVYAYLKVSAYNIIIQQSQPVIISRIDKIESDMNLWKNDNRIKGPIHLTMRGMIDLQGYDYNRLIPKLYSIGFGVLPYTVNKEYLVENLHFNRNDIGLLEVQEEIENPYKKTKYLNNDLIMSDSLILQQPSYPLLIYKFKIYKETFPDPLQPAVLVDTGMYYTQYKEITKFGKLKLSIKYERS